MSSYISSMKSGSLRIWPINRLKREFREILASTDSLGPALLTYYGKVGAAIVALHHAVPGKAITLNWLILNTVHVLGEIHASGQSVTITHHGKPIALLSPVTEEQVLAAVPPEALIAPTSAPLIPAEAWYGQRAFLIGPLSGSNIRPGEIGVMLGNYISWENQLPHLPWVQFNELAFQVPLVQLQLLRRQTVDEVDLDLILLSRAKEWAIEREDMTAANEVRDLELKLLGEKRQLSA